MFSITYISALAGVILLGGFLVLMYSHMGRFYGHTLSEWIERTRRKNDEFSAEKLLNVRKRLEIMAHDILKHRLLGLASLVQEIKLETDNGKKISSLTQERLDSISAEVFRLCGIKAGAEERLWVRWRDCFMDVFQHTGINTAVPLIDPMFSVTLRELMALRRLIMSYVDAEGSRATFLEKVMHLQFENCVNLYPDVLALGDACRMVVNPADVVQRSVDAVASQTRRADIVDNIVIYHRVDQKLLCPAAYNTLVMCVTRLIDNALEIGGKAGISVELCCDEFMGSSSLVFKVYDISEVMPAPNDYGMGIRGIKHRIAVFEGGLQFRSEKRDAFKKAAVLSFPVSEYAEFPVSHLPKRLKASFAFVGFVCFGGFIGCLLYVLGGPPVEFAGRGTNIVEFSVNVGEQLEIPLCAGGRNVRVETNIVNEACMADNCTFGQVLQSLEPCAVSLEDPDCPGAIRWTPQFNDGQRQGKNYELTIHCISEGPPGSDDLRRIRVLVSRPNSAPRVLLIQLLNKTRGDVHYIQQNQTVKVGVSDQVILRAMASDDDADSITYRLHQPNGTTLSSGDGTFWLESDWSLFATSTFDLEISDNIAPPLHIPIVLEADQLHPVEMRSMGLWATGSVAKHACEGTSESRICHLGNNTSNALEMQIWFDPMQPQIRPVLDFHISDAQGLVIRPAPQNGNIAAPGNHWEIYWQQSGQLDGIIELTNIEQTQTPGLYNFTFNVLTSPTLSDSISVAVNLSVSEMSGRMPELKTLIIFSRRLSPQTPVSFSSRHIELTEYEHDEQMSLAQASTWIYPNQINRSSAGPSLGQIICQTPEFADAFEAPVLRNIHNAWRLDFKLKRGCIPGLSQVSPGKSRLCAVNVRLDSGQSQSEALWIMLKPRSCEPRIEALNLSSSKEELNSNIFKWRFKIVDPDGDLNARNIDVRGTSAYSINIDSQDSTMGNVYTGEVSVSTSCDNPVFTPTNSKIALSVRDDDEHEIQKLLYPQLNCPSLVSTSDGRTVFDVDEGDFLSVPLIYDNDVKVAVNGHFGAVANHAFEWSASCLYGNGPHIIEISGESPTRYGRPLQLQINISHCQPRLELSIDDVALTPGAPVILPVNTTKRLRISGNKSLDEFTVIPSSMSNLPHLLLNVIEQGTDWVYELSCDKAGVSEDLRIQLVPKSGADLAHSEPVRIPVECVEP
ncbi:MAG: hypothetical protein IJM59_04955 [Proteobacteria bacterium]|nr:hypothetical protein [Pseudomonadota bacterium]